MLPRAEKIVVFEPGRAPYDDTFFHRPESRRVDNEVVEIASVEQRKEAVLRQQRRGGCGKERPARHVIVIPRRFIPSNAAVL